MRRHFSLSWQSGSDRKHFPFLEKKRERFRKQYRGLTKPKQRECYIDQTMCICIVNAAVRYFLCSRGPRNNSNLFETSDKFELIRKKKTSRRQCTTRCIKLSIVEITKASESIVGEQV